MMETLKGIPVSPGVAIGTAFVLHSDTSFNVPIIACKDSTKAVEIPFSFIEDATGAGTFKGTLSIFSGDYGVTKKNTTGKDKVVVMITVPVRK